VNEDSTSAVCSWSDSQDLEGEQIFRVGTDNPGLKQLAVSSWTTVGGLPDQALSPLAAFSNLSHLSLTQHLNLVVADIDIVTQNCARTLTSLRLTGSNVTWESVLLVTSRCSNLEDLGLARARDLCLAYGQTQIHTKNALISISNLSKLTTLDLSDLGKVVGDSVVVAITLACSELKALHLQRSSITDKAVNAIGRNCPKLQSLDLSRNADIGSSALSRSVASLPLLQNFFCKGCPQLRDSVLVAAVQHCRKLKALAITGEAQRSGSLTDAALQCFLQQQQQQAPSVQHLYLYDQPKLTSAAAKALRAACPTLRLHLRPGTNQYSSPVAVLRKQDRWDWEQFREKAASLKMDKLEDPEDEDIRHRGKRQLEEVRESQRQRYQYFETAWNKLVHKRDKGQRLCLADLKSPSHTSDLLLPHLSANKFKARLRELSLRYHPDKFRQQFCSSFEAGELEVALDRVTGIFQLVTAAKKREAR